jgi:hypothetical protein
MLRPNINGTQINSGSLMKPNIFGSSAISRGKRLDEVCFSSDPNQGNDAAIVSGETCLCDSLAKPRLNSNVKVAQ